MTLADTAITQVSNGAITTPQGFRAGATDASIREDVSGLDLAFLVADRRCAAAACYTTNRFQAPPLLLTQQHLADGQAQAVIVDAGVANSLTGEQGMLDAQEMTALAAEQLGVAVEDVVVASTGVTGWPLPMDRIRAGVQQIVPTEDGGDDFAHAIMTTDTVAKQTAVRFEWAGVSYAVGGVAKGSGMVRPDMATMLAFLTTDAPVEPAALQPLLRAAVDASFNMLTIDEATSTNDMALLLASGAAGGEPMAAGHPALPLLGAALEQVAITLTRELARDGEGATKLLEVCVEGAVSLEDARRAAKTAAGSLLLKAAMFGNDPNWGRVLDAVGYSGAEAREEDLSLTIQDVEVFGKGEPLPYDEAALAEALAGDEVRIRVDIGRGEATATAWGCDLTPEYVRINSEYTT